MISQRQHLDWRHAVLATLVFGSLAWMLSLEPIAQSTSYHFFADTRTLLGLATVVYWHWTDDLRPYIWFQLIPFLTIPAVMMLFRSGFSRHWLLLVAAGWYGLAKVAELYDSAIFLSTHELISGHTLKHLLAAAGCYSILLMIRTRKVLTPSAD